MFAQSELDRLVSAMRANGVTSLQIDGGGDRLRLVLAPPPTHPDVVAPRFPARIAAKSNGIGVFLARGSDDGLPLLAPSADVEPDEILGYLCRGAVRGLITAPAAGRLVGDPPQEGALFGYGDSVFQIEVKS